MSQSFEVLVVGSGPAGIAAAVSAAEHGLGVGLIDENPSAGGQIWRKSLGNTGPDASHDNSAAKWCDRLTAARIVRLQGWSVFDQPSQNTLRAERGNEAADFECEKLILATGARERFLPFPGWTLPNVMGVGAIQAMIKGGLPVRGKRVVIAGSGPLLLAVAASLKAAGAVVLCICEQTSISRLAPFAFDLIATPGKIAEGIRFRAATLEIPFHTSAWPVAAIGDGRVTAVKLSIQGAMKTISCDYLACGFHLTPNIELPALIGCKLNEDKVAVDEWQQTSLPNIYCAGEPTGIGGLELSLIEGEIAGLSCANQPQKARALFSKRSRLSRFAARLAKAFALRHELKSLAQQETLVCRCEDVAFGEVCKHSSWRTAKLQTRCGMGPCQGRICGSAINFLLGWNVDSIRPPVLPALISSLASSRPPGEAQHTSELSRRK
jgi:NADPH-dependent 2,4-dienoyl-CoA reductase/sulfur reductase-like enzyme